MAYVAKNIGLKHHRRSMDVHPSEIVKGGPLLLDDWLGWKPTLPGKMEWTSGRCRDFPQWDD
jgi:hypothetical protein